MRNLKKKPIQIYATLEQQYPVRSFQKEGCLPLEKDPAAGLVGLGSSGNGDLSRQHDKYLTRYHSSKK